MDQEEVVVLLDEMEEPAREPIGVFDLLGLGTLLSLSDEGVPAEGHQGEPSLRHRSLKTG